MTAVRGGRQTVRAAALASALAVVLAAGCSASEPAAAPTTSAAASTSTTTVGTSTTGPAATTATTGSPSVPGSVPVDLPDVTAAGLVDSLVVATPSPSDPPYVRDLFDGGDWAYDPGSGCNTRERVLIEESLVEPTVDDRCRSTNGRWRSAYDGVETTDVADLEIDHLVPLADAWRSGAWRWSTEERLAFANDLTSPDELIAVTSSTNRSKGDSSPDEWMPPRPEAWCDYASAWVRVKARWALTVTPAEKAALVRLLADC